METKRASKTNWKHITVCVIILVLFVVTIGVNIKAESSSEEVIADSSNELVPLKANERIRLITLEEKEKDVAGPKEQITVNYSEIDGFISNYDNELHFFSKCFGVKYDDIVKDIRLIYKKNGVLIESNIGHLVDKKGNVKEFHSPDRGLVEYFYDYVERNPKKVNNKRVAYTGDAEYVENLIVYFSTKVYDNVDTNIALSIGAAESGYYKVKYMLKCNNVFGGMSSHGLTKYKNIEYGVLSYIRILSNGYFDNGLTTVTSIGRKYCPKRDDDGNKVASPHWINLVNTAMKKYKSYNLEINVSDFYI